MAVGLKFIPDNSMGQDFVNQADNFDLQVHHDDEDVFNTSLKFAFVNLESSSTPESEKSIGFRSSIHQEPNADAIDLDKSINMNDSTVKSTTPSSVPLSSVPPSTVPETSVPESSVPPSSVPESSVPPSSVPDSSVPPSSVPDFDCPSGDLVTGFRTGNNDEANDSDDLDELNHLNHLKRRRESNDSDQLMDSPIHKAAKKQRGIRRFLNRPDNVEALFQAIESDPTAPSIKRIEKSTRQPKNGNGVTHVMDILIDGKEFKLNQSDVTSSGIIRFLCSKRKYDPRKENKQNRCKGGCDVILRDLGAVDERKVSNRIKFFVKRQLTLEDIKITEIMNHSCTEKSLTERYEDSLTEKAIQLVKKQKEILDLINDMRI